jgi:hypothetical protein
MSESTTSRFSDKPARAKTPLDNNKLQLYAMNDEGKSARLLWSIINNNPRITVYTNMSTDSGEEKNFGRISANLDMPVFMTVLELLNNVGSLPNGEKYVMENKGYTYVGGRRSDNPTKVSELWIGKDAEGVVWLSVVAEGRPKIKFELLLPSFHTLMSASTGQPLGKAKVSEIVAKGYVRLLTQLVPVIYNDHYVEPAELPDRPNDNKFGNKSGGFKQSTIDDDLSF